MSHRGYYVVCQGDEIIDHDGDRQKAHRAGARRKCRSIQQAQNRFGPDPQQDGEG